MKKQIAAILVSIAAVLPFPTAIALDAAIPPQYEESFLGGLKIKEEYAASLTDRKILLVGGSNLPFGVDCSVIEQHTGMKTVNFGLYAALGTKYMLDQSRAYIEKGDIVIICPETNEQTMSLYFGAETVWQTVDAYPSALTRLRFSDIVPMLSAYPAHLAQSFRLSRQSAPMPAGVYSASSFDIDGDLIYPREKNILPLGYDPNMTIRMTPELVTEEFTDYINEYTAYAERKGAHVFYTFPPMNREAVLSTDEEHVDFYWALAEQLDCPVISSPENYIYDPALFYDSNFHLNDIGVPIRSAQLAEDILRAAGYPVYVEIPDFEADITEPSVTPDESETLTGNDMPSGYTETDAAFFKTDVFGAGVVITGMTEEGTSLDFIVVPSEIEGKTVLAAGENAFSGCSDLKEVVLPASVIQLYDGVFRGCTKLECIVLSAGAASSVSVGENLMEGADNAYIYVPSDAYVSFVSDYFWSRYAAFLRTVMP